MSEAQSGADVQEALPANWEVQDKTWEIEDMVAQKLLSRDRLWTKGLGRPQSEFVVDNQTVAAIAMAPGGSQMNTTVHR